jgi:hypothetical protein
MSCQVAVNSGQERSVILLFQLRSARFQLYAWFFIHFIVVAVWLSARAASAAVELDAASALPPGSGQERGFSVRMVQAPNADALPNSYLRALQQINGTLTDNTGNQIANVALPGPAAGRAYPVDTIDFSIVPQPMGLSINNDADEIEITPVFFPGIPGSTGSVSNFATEVTGFVELDAGEHLLSVVVAAERTDANDDDDYRWWFGSRPRDFFAPLGAQYERRSIFWKPTTSENIISVTAPVSGLYPFRVLHWQTGFGSVLFMFSVDADTQEHILLNDPKEARAVKVFRTATKARNSGPYVGEVNPFPNSAGIKPGAAIKLVLMAGTTGIEASATRLYANNTLAQPRTEVHNTSQSILIYALPTDPTRSNVLLRLEYADLTGLKYTNLWTYELSSGTVPKVTGQWDFDQGDLSATVGLPLEYFDGADGLTAAATRFGTSDELGLPPMPGGTAQVMEVPSDLTRSIGYTMHHGVAPNGGGTRVNQYTILFDLMVSSEGTWAASLLQISSTNNLEDGDLFWQENQFGQGLDGYFGTSIFTPDQWHRVIAAYDMSANPPVVTKYVDGVFQDDWTAYQGLDHPRRALLPVAILFADGDQDERRMMWVNSIQIRAGALTKAQMEALGGPTAPGIPEIIPAVEPTPPISLKVEQFYQNQSLRIRVTWPVNATNCLLEAAVDLVHPDWQPVPGVTNHQVELMPEVGQQFYRLRTP